MTTTETQAPAPRRGNAPTKAAVQGWGRTREARGLSPLTDRERQVLALTAQGLTTRQIAEALFVSKRTVDFHRYNIMAILQVPNMISALAKTGTWVPTPGGPADPHGPDPDSGGAPCRS